MLIALNIRDFVLIDTLDLEIGSGFTALSGETGAGKSIILDALGQALGDRAEKRFVRQNCEQAIIAAQFAPIEGHPCWQILAEHDLYADPSEPLTLRRVLKTQGSARSFINDQPVSNTLLKALGASFIEIHAQHSDQGLMQPRQHRQLLDNYGGLHLQTTKVAEAWADWQEKAKAYQDLQDRINRADEERDFLTHAVQELEDLAPEAGEEAKLANQRILLQNMEKLSLGLEDASQAMEDNSVSNALGRAARALERSLHLPGMDGNDSDDPLLKTINQANHALERALIEVEEAQTALCEAKRYTGFDPQELESRETRLFQLRALARKHNIDVNALPELLTQLRIQLDQMAHTDMAMDQAHTALDAAKSSYIACAETLCTSRQLAAEKLAHAVEVELKPLKLDKAKFRVSLQPLTEEKYSSNGMENIAFEISTNPGMPFGPMQQIASGGELARCALALQVVLAGQTHKASMVFDEADHGVGGAVAMAVGEHLKRLASARQVLAVTHSPQVVAIADHHWHIQKTASAEHSDQLVTQIRVLNTQERYEEIARMLSGSEISDEARAAARKLLSRA